MHFKSIAAFVALVLPVMVLAAPVPDAPSDDMVYFFARAITVTVSARSDGDYSKLLARPARPDTPPPGCTKKEKNDYKKANKKCTTWDDLDKEFKGIVTTRVEAALTAAEHTLHLNGPIHAGVKSAFHTNLAHDNLPHWTFTFAAPICHGECTGHAYDTHAPRHARIWSADHRLLFDA
jgi:hypothetical protein